MKLIQQAGKTGSSAKCLMGSGGRSDFSSPKFSSHEAKLIGYGESASQKLKDAEDNILKNAHNIASHSNLLREHTENINTFISTNAIFNSQILRGRPIYLLKANRYRYRYRYIGIGILDIGIGIIGIGIGIGYEK